MAGPVASEFADDTATSASWAARLGPYAARHSSKSTRNDCRSIWRPPSAITKCQTILPRRTCQQPVNVSSKKLRGFIGEFSRSRTPITLAVTCDVSEAVIVATQSCC
jgi:hypothetical protein